MTNAELIQKIRTEIERRKKEIHATVFNDEFDSLLSFLSTLGSEKPMNLEEEIKKEMVKLPFFIRGKDQIAFARHFAQCGAEHEKEELMKEVVEGEVVLNPYPTICLDDCKDYDFKDGDKVRIIIVKEG